MKNLIFGLLATVLFSSNSFALNTVKEKEIVKSEVVKSEDIKTKEVETEKKKIEIEPKEEVKFDTKTEAQADGWIEFICWLFNGKCV
jgi:hypothetical protein